MDIVRRKLTLVTIGTSRVKENVHIFILFITLLLSGELNNCSLIFFLFVIAVLF